MRDAGTPVAIVDYGLGNLYSVQRACAHVGLRASITATPAALASAAGIILPGVGAMPTAMSRLRSTGLADALIAAAGKGTPILGVCLGLQLLMRHGTEFGDHDGLGLLDGRVARFAATDDSGAPVKVPHIGWSAVTPSPSADAWADTPLEDVEPGSMMYFVHSYYVVPANPSACVATTRYGSEQFCAAIAKDNIFACQFHPERSGPAGLQLYARFARTIQQTAISR